MTKNEFVFSQASVFHLQKLAKDVHTCTGKRHRLADQNSMLKLLKTAVLTNDTSVKTDLDNFVKDLDKRQIESLMRHGVLLRRTA